MSEPALFVAIESRQRLVDRVVEQVTRLIAGNKLAPGTRLPPEMKLAESIGVSRTVVREAIQILTARGLVETRHGVGTIVRAAGSRQFAEHLQMLLNLNGMTLDDLHQVRSILEVEIAGIAAAQASPADQAALAAMLERMSALTGDPLAYADADGEFHRALAHTAHNPLLVILLDSISALMREVRLAVSNVPGLYERSLNDHRILLAQIKTGDAPGARQAMREHLQHARQIQKSIENPA